MKLYTEEQIAEAVMFGRWGGTMKKDYEEFLNKLTPIELPSDEEIEQESHIQYPVNLQPNGRTLAGGRYDIDINYSERNAYILSAKWMREQILNKNK